MKKRIVICADGTWNRPEEDIKDHPTNVLKLARAVRPHAQGTGNEPVPQQVFYDWGLGSYHDRLTGGITGRGIDKNITDCYRYIVQNYDPGDELFLFGFSRGAYTVRSLCGLIHNCGILRRPEARRIREAFDGYYKSPAQERHPDGAEAVRFRERYAHEERSVTFVGVWDTVGALGIPFSFLGFLEAENEFYDTRIGPNVLHARHALAIDEKRSDFEPTIWDPREHGDLKQVWFAGTHSDVGGGYAPDEGTGHLLADIPFGWMIREAGAAGLVLEDHLAAALNGDPCARMNESRRHIFRSKTTFHRPIAHGKGEVLIHGAVRERWERDPEYRPPELEKYLAEHGWPEPVE